MFTIDQLAAWEIFDSHGRPTVTAWAMLRGGGVGVTQVPPAPQPASTRPSNDATAIPPATGVWA